MYHTSLVVRVHVFTLDTVLIMVGPITSCRLLDNFRVMSSHSRSLAFLNSKGGVRYEMLQTFHGICITPRERKHCRSVLAVTRTNVLVLTAKVTG